mgnify:CR=1 FL=1
MDNKKLDNIKIIDVSDISTKKDKINKKLDHILSKLNLIDRNIKHIRNKVDKLSRDKIIF